MSDSLIAPPAIDPRVFRDTLGHYASGITVVSAIADGEPVGFTCQSFYSVSVDPPLVSFSVMRTSTTYPRIAAGGRFTVNVLAHDQHHISNQFARKGTDKWAGIAWRPARSGNPVIDATLMWVDCEAWAEYEAGDHLVIIGRVVEMSSPEWHTGSPLLYFKGGYRHLQELAG
ncbi:flavin reductase (DIM6/NTAB) family NADH-FMN oxidoreductase RutF [Microbacterium sp. AG1240]|uniref:flavin reductase family protein n=1 Tax=Microbacterium sp. AG1240 TaxID=2183992 RepID=UPI000EB31AD5|nr:flavin reductase family protein [Microbacterium sp. AG1240]RKT35792.1 flavin reductase (DIM6/NTAB) family NADH-FMN oxidoreductase RutF [Microbacterium sp. AG1240]